MGALLSKTANKTVVTLKFYYAISKIENKRKTWNMQC